MCMYLANFIWGCISKSAFNVPGKRRTARLSGVDETPGVMKHVCKTAHVRSLVGHRNVLCGAIGKVSVWSFERYIGSDEARELGGAVAVSV